MPQGQVFVCTSLPSCALSRCIRICKDRPCGSFHPRHAPGSTTVCLDFRPRKCREGFFLFIILSSTVSTMEQFRHGTAFAGNCQRVWDLEQSDSHSLQWGCKRTQLGSSQISASPTSRLFHVKTLPNRKENTHGCSEYLCSSQPQTGNQLMFTHRRKEKGTVVGIQ